MESKKVFFSFFAAQLYLALFSAGKICFSQFSLASEDQGVGSYYALPKTHFSPLQVGLLPQKERIVFQLC